PRRARQGQDLHRRRGVGDGQRRGGAVLRTRHPVRDDDAQDVVVGGGRVARRGAVVEGRVGGGEGIDACGQGQNRRGRAVRPRDRDGGRVVAAGVAERAADGGAVVLVDRRRTEGDEARRVEAIQRPGVTGAGVVLRRGDQHVVAQEGDGRAEA